MNMKSSSEMKPSILWANTTSAPSTSKDLELGPLPEWNLADLYSGMDAPEFEADFVHVETESKSFSERYKGKLDVIARAADAAQQLTKCITTYEAIDDRLGRILSYAGLVYAGDTSDARRSKFYGDTQDRATKISSDLLFFTLELNRIDDSILDAAAAKAPLAHYKPWLADIRMEKPFQLEDRLEQVFLEKSVTASGA